MSHPAGTLVCTLPTSFKTRALLLSNLVGTVAVDAIDNFTSTLSSTPTQASPSSSNVAGTIEQTANGAPLFAPVRRTPAAQVVDRRDNGQVGQEEKKCTIDHLDATICKLCNQCWFHRNRFCEPCSLLAVFDRLIFCRFEVTFTSLAI